jgi:hypothetical protein
MAARVGLFEEHAVDRCRSRPTPRANTAPLTVGSAPKVDFDEPPPLRALGCLTTSLRAPTKGYSHADGIWE